MNGMPRPRVISLQLAGHVHLQLLALDHARPGDEEEGPVEADVETAKFHQALPPPITFSAGSGTRWRLAARAPRG